MTDPLSVSASIAGLVTLADIVFRRAYNYVKAVKKGPKEISALSDEIGSLYGILSRLQLVSHQLEGEAFDSTARVHHIHSCYQTLENVKSILDRDDTSALQNQRLEKLKRKLRWPFTSAEVAKIIAEIERHKATLALALNVDCMSGLLQALSRQDDIREGIEGIKIEMREKREAETRVRITEERKKMLDSFSKVDPQTNHNMSLKLRHPSTGLWLTDGQPFRQWLSGDDNRLWLYGIPGAGKTILAASVIEEAVKASSPSIAVAFFYCDYKDPATQDLSSILGSLAQQFAKQDEQSFEKLRNFYETHNPEHRDGYLYDSEDLGKVLRDIASGFDCAMIIVDGLDECGRASFEVVDALASLNEEENSTIKTLFLSRDEIEIRERVEGYNKVSIAAKSSDLRLYVGAEIEMRIRKKVLRIKDQSLKENIMQRLVEGAQGMFRWVACQMDYVCELPNDAARRTALETLPPDLKSTYERILRRVNESNPENQKLVRRTLRWLANVDKEDLTTNALCEAVSINFEDTRRNLGAVPDEFDMLKWCSSLVRKSENDSQLELAHFTVKEFLIEIEITEGNSLYAYRVDPRNDKIQLTKLCLTYLSFEDFDCGGPINKDDIERRLRDYALRGFAVLQFFYGHGDHEELLPLVTKLLNPSKPNSLISLLHDLVFLTRETHLESVEWVRLYNRGLAEASALHFAAMMSFASAVRWLIKSGCDVNRNSTFGTPLHCALMQWDAMRGRLIAADDYFSWGYEMNVKTVGILLEAGADPNCWYTTANTSASVSSVFMALSLRSRGATLQLLDKGGMLDSDCLDLLEKNLLSNEVNEIIAHASSKNVRDEHLGRLLQLASRTKTASTTLLLHEDSGHCLQKSHYENALRTAAEFGQTEAVFRILKNHELDINAAQEHTGLTALHLAAMNDHVEVVIVLLDKGADLLASGLSGKTAVHHSASASGAFCLSHLLQLDASTDLGDDAEGPHMGHSAAPEDTLTATHARRKPVNGETALGLKSNDGRTPFLCASQSGSIEAIKMLLSAGSCLTETALDGSSPLHYAAKACCLEAIEVLIERQIDPNVVTHDGSSALHYCVMGHRQNMVSTARLLIESGLDACRARKNGNTPLHDLLKLIEEDNEWPLTQREDAFASSQLLLNQMLEKRRTSVEEDLGAKMIYLACRGWKTFSTSHEFVLSLLEAKFSPNTSFAKGKNAIMLAAEAGNVDIMTSLLSHGADPLKTDDLGLGPLHDACFCGHKDILVVLRETGIDWDVQTTAEFDSQNGFVPADTVLHLAAGCDNCILEYLLDEGLANNVNVTTKGDKRTPLMIAVTSRNARNVSLLLSKDVDTTLTTTDGDNAIHLAARLGDHDIIREFIKHGCDMVSLNDIGLSPEWVAWKHGHKDLAQTIRHVVHEPSSYQHFFRQALILHSTASSLVLLTFSVAEASGMESSKTKSGARQQAAEAFIVAIGASDLTLCQRLVDDGVDLGSGIKSCLGCSPLLYSLIKREERIAYYLATQEKSVGGSTCSMWMTEGWTVFHYAAAYGSARLFETLLKRWPREFSDCGPVHAIHTAVAHGKDDCVRLMLDYAAKANGGIPPITLQGLVDLRVQGDMLRWDWYIGLRTYLPKGLNNASPLHIAAAEGDVKIAKVLLEFGATVDSIGDDGRTPMQLAALKGHAAMVRYLLESGANINAVDANFQSACMLAASSGHVVCLQLMVDVGADLMLQDCMGLNALHLATLSSVLHAFVLLANTIKGCDLSLEDFAGYSIINCAISRFPMTYLLSIAPSTSAYEPRRFNILTTAVRHRSTREVRLLLRRLPINLLPTFLNHCDEYGCTPLYCAASVPMVDTISLLLDAGADIEFEGSEHGTPLMAACANGRLEAVKVLIARGAKTSYEKDGRYHSVLFAAKHHSQVRRWLLVGRFLEMPKLLACADIG